jgi:hypothetical protein
MAAAAFVIADEVILQGLITHPVLPHRAFDVVAEMGHPVGRPDKRRSLSRHRVGQPHAVGGTAERDVLAGRRRLRFRRRSGGSVSVSIVPTNW